MTFHVLKVDGLGGQAKDRCACVISEAKGESKNPKLEGFAILPAPTPFLREK